MYSSHDSEFVDGTLCPLLEDIFHLKCCIHHRDFIPGAPFVENMANSVLQSRKIIVVMSKHFFQSNHCDFELQIALQRLLEWGDDSVLVIKVATLGRRKLPVELTRRSYIDYSSLVERVSWKDRLFRYLTHSIATTTNVDQTNNNDHLPVLNSAVQTDNFNLHAVNV